MPSFPHDSVTLKQRLHHTAVKILDAKRLASANAREDEAVARSSLSVSFQSLMNNRQDRDWRLACQGLGVGYVPAPHGPFYIQFVILEVFPSQAFDLGEPQPCECRDDDNSARRLRQHWYHRLNLFERVSS